MSIRTTSGRLGSASRMLVFLLLTLYVIGALPVELIHSFSYHHKTLPLHSPEEEKDPCHRSMYHNDIEAGCDHDAHLTASDKCEMCGLAHHGDQTVLLRPDAIASKVFYRYFDCYKLSLDTYWAVISSSRAPPALI